MAQQWLALVFPALAAELWNLDGRLPGVWIADIRQRVWQMDRGAVRQGLQIGMSTAQAKALAPEIQMVARAAEQEHNLLDRAAQLLYAWGPQVVALTEWPHVLAVELQGNRLWRENAATLLQAIHDFAGERLSYRLGLAATPLAAALLAWQCSDAALCQCPAEESFADCWHAFPLSLFPAPDHLRALWQSLGLQTCADWMRLDPQERALRFGPEWERFFARMRGEEADPRNPWPVQEEFLVSFPLLQEVGSWEELRFSLRRAFQELRLRLRHRASSGWELCLRGRADEQYCAQLHSRDPLTNPEFFLQLWQEKLLRYSWDFPIRYLQLRTLDAQDWIGEQGSLWEQDLARQQGQLLDRWRARLGVDQVYRVQVHADHRPEYAWRVLAPDGSQDHFPLPDCPPRPLWLLPQPVAITPVFFPEPAELERIEGGWWDGRDCSRDYFRWRRIDGAECWVFRDRRSGHYFLHGYFA